MPPPYALSWVRSQTLSMSSLVSNAEFRSSSSWSVRTLRILRRAHAPGRQQEGASGGEKVHTQCTDRR
jgi:hypothetical protein